MNFYDYGMTGALIMFLGVFVLRTIVLARAGVKVFVIGSGKNGIEKFLELVFFVFFPVWIAGFLTMALTGKIFFLPGLLSEYLWEPVIAKSSGILMALSAVILFAAALKSFRESWRIGIDADNPGRLITDGIFSYSRNPIFLSMYIFFTAVFLVYPNLFFLVFAAGTITGIHVQILNEEKFLRKHYGRDYIDYTKMVRRYF